MQNDSTKNEKFLTHPVPPPLTRPPYPPLFKFPAAAIRGNRASRDRGFPSIELTMNIFRVSPLASASQRADFLAVVKP